MWGKRPRGKDHAKDQSIRLGGDRGRGSEAPIEVVLAPPPFVKLGVPARKYLQEGGLEGEGGSIIQGRAQIFFRSRWFWGPTRGRIKGGPASKKAGNQLSTKTKRGDKGGWEQGLLIIWENP